MDAIEMTKVAMGGKKADLVLKNCSIVNVFNGKIEKGDIAIYKSFIAGMGEYEGVSEIDLEGRYVCPGFIDGHVHIESSLMTPPRFAEAVMAKGTTTVIADPHEIANVCGTEGIRYMLESSRNLPLDVFIMLPSCVPSTEFENAGAKLDAGDLGPLMDNPRVLGLGEMMNCQGVITGDPGVYGKLDAARGMIIDGHAPGVTGKGLNAYIASGIRTDHECTKTEEMLEKISRGMYVHIREGSATRNLETLIKGVDKTNLRRIMFCTDDKNPADIQKEGHINYNIKKSIENGIDPVDAVTMATLNTAECYGLSDRGAITPGYMADIVVMEDIRQADIHMVIKNGKIITGGRLRKQIVTTPAIEAVRGTVKLGEDWKKRLSLPLKSDVVKVIRIIKDNITTEKVIRKVDLKNGEYMNNPKLDILKLAVIERHGKTGGAGVGLVEGYGLENGAVALTIAHDSHNIIVIGDNDDDMAAAVGELERLEGGICICSNGEVRASLRLEIAGLMTDSPITEVVGKLKDMTRIARGLGVYDDVDPFMTLSFLALPVIPEIKLTDRGLFDTRRFKFVSTEE